MLPNFLMMLSPQIEQQKEEETVEAQTPDVTITMLKDSSEAVRGRKGSAKREFMSD